jgi:hypothetical protein
LDDDVAAMIVLQSHLDEVRRPKAEVWSLFYVENLYYNRNYS